MCSLFDYSNTCLLISHIDNCTFANKLRHWFEDEDTIKFETMPGDLYVVMIAQRDVKT